MSETLGVNQLKECPANYILAVNDTVSVLVGKWKLPIIGSLYFGKKRFKEIERGIPKITARMLSKELKDLEFFGVISRTVYNTTPVTVEYELTQSGESFKEVLDSMIHWGLQHRKQMMGEEKKVSTAVYAEY